MDGTRYAEIRWAPALHLGQGLSLRDSIAAVVAVGVRVLLGAIIATARSIDRHALAIWIVGKQIAGNTVSIWMLEKAANQLEQMLDSLRSLLDIESFGWRDALDILPLFDAWSVDLLLADPPYGVDWQSGRRIDQFPKIIGDDARPCRRPRRESAHRRQRYPGPPCR